ncbi:MAG TPA: sugar transferase [Ktedonobacteraceae bacterium]|nr:sugar transferase [Ktedonobacteraceae bacterium]
MARSVQNKDVSALPYADTGTGNQEMIGGATGPITKAIYRRRVHRRQWRIFECIFMFLVDAALIGFSVYLAFTFRYYALPTSMKGKPDIKAATTLATFIIVGLLVIFATRRLYTLRLTGNWFRQVWIIITSTTFGIALLIAYYFVFQNSNLPDGDLAPQLPNSRLLVPLVWVTTICVLCLGRLVISGVIGLLYRLGLGETRLLVVGSGRLGKMVMQHITANPTLGYSIVGFLHDLNEPPSDFGRFKMLGTIDDLGMVIRSMQIDEVIIALPSHMHQHAIRSVKMCERLGASFKLIPDLYELSLSRIDMEAIEGIPLIGIKQVSLNKLQQAITRMVDIGVAALVLILGSPIWLLLVLSVMLSSPGPVIYRQTRIGLNGKPFNIYKFRSMYKDADERLAQLLARNEAQGPLFKMREDPRITPIGKFLRRVSLDEIPQFFNVIKGDMSLVGPRPPVPREVAQYEEWQKGRLAIKPGLTGLWQVRGRSDISFDEGVLMDLYYIENWSLRLYFQILLRTIPAVLFSRGAY